MLLVCILQQGLFLVLTPHTKEKWNPTFSTWGFPNSWKTATSKKQSFLRHGIIGTFLFTWSLSDKHGQWIPWCFKNLLTLALPQPVGISFLTSHLCVPLPDVNHPLKRDRTWRYDPGPCRQKPWLQHGWPCWWHDGIMPQLLWHDFILVFKNMCWSWMT